jgi:hypothetical protein
MLCSDLGAISKTSLFTYLYIYIRKYSKIWEIQKSETLPVEAFYMGVLHSSHAK